MKGKFLLLFCLTSLRIVAQNDSTNSVAPSSEQNHKGKWNEDDSPVRVFYGQRLINANTAEVLHKGVMEFRVTHNFGDIAGNSGGVKRFFGLDNAADIKIGFQIGLGNKLNIVAARTRGDEGSVGDGSVRVGELQQLWELGLKYQFLRQGNDSKHPFTLTLYANNVISSMDTVNKNLFKERSFNDFGDRMSQVVQLMIARRFGKISLQLSPTYVHTNYVVSPQDDKNLFALGGAARIPITKSFFLIGDYFHTFRSEGSKVFLGAHNIHLHDVFGVGVEIVTAGHVFHMNFTNATDILENRFIPRTHTSWGDGQYRWGFTIARNFIIFRDKKDK